MVKKRAKIYQHYHSEDYNQMPKFIDYFYQVTEILKVKPKTVLEIGLGAVIAADYLRDENIKITTCDIDEKLNPDVLADVRKLPFKNNSFDCVLICEVLEHLPYSDFEKVLKKLSKIAKKRVVISVPNDAVYFNLMFRFTGSKRFFKKEILNLCVSVPKFWEAPNHDNFYLENDWDGHYWGIGKKGYPLRKIKKSIRKFFKIEKIFNNELAPQHKFFILNPNK